ncbi:MAG: SH3 domain-containing protein [Spirochaetes bacterium]|nr:SH3 domain-containing protein [Spirochaetota bacterium]
MSFKKIHQFMLLALFALYSSYNFSNESRKYFIGAESLNVRKEPSVASDSLFLLKKRTPVDIVEINGNYDRIDGIISPWLKIKSLDGKTGFVFGGYVYTQNIAKYEEDSELEYYEFRTEEKDFNKEVCLIKDDFVYEFPSVSAKKVSEMKAGNKFKVKKQIYKYDSIKDKSWWYSFLLNGKEVYINGKNVLTDFLIQDNAVYGVNSYPSSRLLNYHIPFIETESKIISVSLTSKKILSRTELKEKSDSVTIQSDVRFDKIFNKKSLVVKHDWNHFTTAPIGYVVKTVFLLDDNGEILSEAFSWFEEIGEQFRPFASLVSMNVTKSQILLVYEYYEEIGLADKGYGKIEVEYEIIKNLPVFKNIKSSVKTNTSGNSDEKPELLSFTKNSINDKFRFLSGKYDFIN